MQIISKGVVLSVCFVATTVAAQGEMSHRIKAILVDRESSLHTSLGNRDVYLLHVKPEKGPAFDAIAVDSYPGYAEGLPIALLSKGAAFSVKLTRTSYCDRPIDGDRTGSAVRCFTIDHGSWKLPKNVASDLWWK